MLKLFLTIKAMMALKLGPEFTYQPISGPYVPCTWCSREPLSQDPRFSIFKKVLEPWKDLLRAENTTLVDYLNPYGTINLLPDTDFVINKYPPNPNIDPKWTNTDVRGITDCTYTDIDSPYFDNTINNNYYCEGSIPST